MHDKQKSKNIFITFRLTIEQQKRELFILRTPLDNHANVMG